MSSKIKTAIIGVVLVFVILIIVSLLTNPAPTNNSQPANQSGKTSQNSQPAVPTKSDPPAAPTFQTTEKRFEVVTVRQDGTYRVRDVDANKEIDLFIPADANITAGRRSAIAVGTALTVQRYMTVANGVVATELSIPTKQ